MLQCDLNGDFVSDIERAATRVDDATEAGLDAGAKVLLDGKVEKVDRTYQRPASWTRTGKWKAGQRIRKVSRFKRAITTIGAAAKAIKNHAGGYEERVGKLNTIRRNEAAQDTREEYGGKAENAFTKAFEEKLNL